MPLVFRHDAAGIPLGKGDDEAKKYGMGMVAQQQKYDQSVKMLDQKQAYDTENIGSMQNYNREPTRAELRQQRDMAIRNGAFEGGVVKNIRDLERQEAQILRDRNLNATQMANALASNDSLLRQAMLSGYPQQIAQAMTQSQQPKPISSRQVFRQDPKTMDRFMGIVQQELDNEGLSLPYEDKVRKALELYEKQVGVLADPQQDQQAPPSAQPQGATQSVGSADIRGSAVFGVDPVLASPISGGGTGRGSTSPSQAPVEAVRPSALPNQVQSPAAANGAQVPFTGVRAAPNGSIYGDQGQFLGNTDLYNQAGANYIRQQASPQIDQSQPSPRKWTSADGKYSTDGEFLGVSNPTDGGEPMVKIKKTDGNVVDVPWSKLSDQDRMFASAGGNRDTMYDLQNRSRTPGTNIMDPENPVYKEMRSPQSQQQPNQGQFMGRYGLGGVDYGINQSTGNRVTASIRPGATAVEYDEPVGPPGTAMGGRRGSVSYTGRKKTVASQKSPGEATLEEQARYNALPASPPSSASGTAAASPPAATVTQPSPPRIRRDDPRVKEALAIAGNPDSVTADQRKRAALILDDAGYTTEQIKAEIDSQGTSKPRQESGAKAPSGQPDYGTLLDAHETVRVAAGGVGKDRRTIKQVDDAKAVLKASGWTDKDIQDLYMGRGDKKLDPPVRPQGVWQNRIFKPVVPQGEASPATSAENSVAQPPSSKMRTWTSVEGKTFDGVLVEGSLSSSASDPEDQQMIKVQRKDGEIFNIPVSRLSDEDKAYLDALYKLGNADGWLNRKGIGVSTGEAYKYEKPSSSKDSESAKSMTKQKYKTRESEQPKEMRIKPNSSSMGRVKRTS